MKALFSKNIIKQSIRNNLKLWSVLTVVLCFFITVLTVAINARQGSARFGANAGNMESTYARIFFNTIGLCGIMMLIYANSVGNKLVAGEIDKGTMSFTLNTPVTRKQVILSKMLFHMISLVAMIVLVGAFGTAASSVVGADVDSGKLWNVVLGFLCYSFAISGICFFSSCWFNKSGQALIVGTGFPVAFFLLSTLSSLITINDKEFLKYLSLNTLYDTNAILSGEGFVAQFIVLFVSGAVLYSIGVVRFLRKDLPL